MAVIIHISDMHFQRSINEFDTHISKIADTLFSQTPFSKVVIVISGDIANKADPYEYKAANAFIKRLKSRISEKFNNISKDSITILTVPGNHDMNHNLGELTHSDLENIYKENDFELELAKEVEKLKNYFKFAKVHDCFVTESVCDRKDILINDKKYSFFLINSALFSLKSSEDKGFHYLNDKTLETLLNADGDYNIAIMHHSPYCYTDRIKNNLINTFAQKFTFVMLGHEHYDSKEISGISGNDFTVLHAGALYNENWNKSEFSIIKINNGNSAIKTNFKWNNKAMQYESNGSNCQLEIRPKEDFGLIKVSDEFLSNLKKDERKIISDTFENYFVFPRMEYIDYDKQTKSKEIKNETAFFSELETNKHLHISGNHSLGKTTLLKYIFNKTKGIKTPLLLTVDDFRKKKPERVIKNAFEEIYGNTPSDYEKFLQMPSSDKILLIDDVDCINHNDFNSFILGVEGQFGFIVTTATEKIQFNWKDKMDQDYDYRENFVHYKLTPFFKDKRKELVSVLVPMLKTTPVENDEIIINLCDALDSQKRFAPMTPDFIIQYVDYFCKNIGDVSSYESNTFSKVFEANITNALTPYTTGCINVDKVFLLLSRIAYEANLKKENSIKEETISYVISEYNQDYSNEIRIVDFINICKKAKVLHDAEGGYKFTSKNYLAYFVARGVLQRYSLTNDATDIYNIVNFCCFGINSDILLFIIYLSNNLSILNIILSMLKELIRDWKEYNGDTVKLRYLEETSKIKQEFLEKSSDLVLSEQVQQEQETSDIRDIQTIDIYDFDENEVDDKLNKIIKATSLLNLIARAFPSFEHLIKTDQKKDIVDLLYSAPNKIFYFWASEIEQDYIGFIQYFLQKNDDEYQLDQAVGASISTLRNMSISLLLDLYYGVIHESCKTNTFKFLDVYDHESKYTYQTEYLLAIEQYKKNADLLIQLASKQISKDGIPEELAKRVLYHAINTMPKLNISQRDKMASKINLKSEAVKRIDIRRKQGSINN